MKIPFKNNDMNSFDVSYNNTQRVGDQKKQTK